MIRYVAFLGGINLGKRRVAMKDLQRIASELGLDSVSTFIASGNLVFRSDARTASRLEKDLEKHLSARLGYVVPTFVRTEAEVNEILSVQPFEAVQPGNTVVVILCKEAIPMSAARVLTSIRSPDDAFHIRGRELFWWTVAGLSTSTVWKRPEIKALKLPPSTMRNRNTLQRMAEKFGFGGSDGGGRESR
ncbi:MAG: DUF1697 domain-containing protein [Opitutaceae bacterium]|nr:DUF1697 domain-containing protein [Opitutaceae bacterium]